MTGRRCWGCTFRRSLALCVMVGAFASAAAAGATGNVLGGVLLGLVAFVTTAFVLDLATGATGLRGPVRRTVALGLAIWSHGPAPGKSSDGCFPARARAFERYLRGDGPRPTDGGDDARTG